MSKLGIGVLSFAHGHVNTYCDEIMKYDDADLVACWDDDRERGEQRAATYGLELAKSVDQVLDNPRVNAVLVACETAKHADLCVPAANAKKAILLQKPMALSLADCDRIIQAVEANGVKFSMGHQMRHDPMNQKMKELVDAGTFGNIFMVRRRHCIPVLLNPGFTQGKTNWHIRADMNMGMFMDDASHATDWFHWLLGKPVSVIAEIDNIVTNVAPDDNGVAVYRFSKGEIGILFNSSTTIAAQATTEIYGDQAVLQEDFGDGPSCAVPHAPDAPALKLYEKSRHEEGFRDLGFPIPAGQGERIRAVIRPFIDYLLGDGPPAADAHDGRVAVEMVLGAYQSAHEGRRVTFPLAG